MNALRLEADEAQAKVEELKNKVKALEQENLAKEQEITSLTHRNQVLEAQVEKLEVELKEAKEAASHSAQHDAQNEALQRRLQLLEEEAEEADKTLRETNEKYASVYPHQRALANGTGSAKPTSRPATTSARCRPWRRPATSGSRSTRRWPRSTRSCRRSCTIWRCLSATSKGRIVHGCGVSAHAGFRLPANDSSRTFGTYSSSFCSADSLIHLFLPLVRPVLPSVDIWVALLHIPLPTVSPCNPFCGTERD